MGINDLKKALNRDIMEEQKVATEDFGQIVKSTLDEYTRDINDLQKYKDMLSYNEKMIIRILLDVDDTKKNDNVLKREDMLGTIVKNQDDIIVQYEKCLLTLKRLCVIYSSYIANNAGNRNNNLA